MQCMIIPAAGRGTRLNSQQPKLLYEINGVPLIEYVLRRHNAYIDHFVIVIHPDMQDAVEKVFEHRQYSYSLAYQSKATGMLDAILLATNELNSLSPHAVWISWCDQVAISQHTAETLNRLTAQLSQFGMIVPTITRDEPYIHLQRNSQGTIIKVLQRREGDEMPDVGENDSGLFAMTAATFFQQLSEYSKVVDSSSGTKERNFLPFIAWVAHRAQVTTFSVQNIYETIGVNTVQEAQFLARHLENL